MLITLIIIICLSVGYFIGYKHSLILDEIEKLKHRDQAQPPTLVQSNPIRTRNQIYIPPDNAKDSIIVNTKTPQQIEKEAEQEADRIAGM